MPVQQGFALKIMIPFSFKFSVFGVKSPFQVATVISQFEDYWRIIVDQKLDELLCERYPDLFCQRKLSIQESCMGRGFECGDG